MIILPSEDIPEVVTRADGRLHLIAYHKRVGVTALTAAIEWYWFKPGTARNRFYDVYGAEWHRMRWIIVSFPAGRLPAVRRLAKQIGLRIADGPPVLMGDERSLLNIQAASPPSRLTEFIQQDIPMEFFPGTLLPDGKENGALFTIENDRGSPVYKNQARDEDAMRQASGEICALLNQGVKLTPLQIADYIYGSGSFPNV